MKKSHQIRPIDAAYYSYWQALYMSFYSKRLYVDVGKRWAGLGLGYLALTFIIFLIIPAIKFSFILNTLLNDDVIDPLLKLPAFYVQNGTVLFDKPMPYLIKNKKNQVVLIVDTTGHVNQFNQQYPYLNLLINKKAMYFRMPKLEFFHAAMPDLDLGAPVEQSFGANTNFVFNGKQIIKDERISILKYPALAMTYPLFVSFFFSLFMVILSVFAFLGPVFSLIFFSFKISYKQSSRLMMVAATPMLLMLAFLMTTEWVFLGAGIILLMLLVFYFSLGLYAVKGESRYIVRK